MQCVDRTLAHNNYNKLKIYIYNESLKSTQWDRTKYPYSGVQVTTQPYTLFIKTFYIIGKHHLLLHWCIFLRCDLKKIRVGYSGTQCPSLLECQGQFSFCRMTPQSQFLQCWWGVSCMYLTSVQRFKLSGSSSERILSSGSITPKLPQPQCTELAIRLKMYTGLFYCIQPCKRQTHIKLTAFPRFM